MDENDGEAQGTSARRRAILLTAWQRAMATAFGLASAGAGATSVFLTGNQAGSTALLILGGAAFLMGLTGRVPERIGKEGIVYEIVDPGTRAATKVMSDPEVPLPAREQLAEAVQDELSQAAMFPETASKRYLSQSELAAAASAVLFESEVYRLVESNLPRGATIEPSVTLGTSRLDAILRPVGVKTPDPSECVVLEFDVAPTSSTIRRTLEKLSVFKPGSLVYVVAAQRGSPRAVLAFADFNATVKFLKVANAHFVIYESGDLDSRQRLLKAILEGWVAIGHG